MQLTERNSTAARVTLVALAGLALLLVGLWFGRATAPFGDSDEGINGAVWAANSRSLRELGPIDSRLGGKRLDGTLYASHPPLIVIETAAAESVLGEEEWASRLPAWLGTLVALGLLHALLRSAGVDPVASFGAVAATAFTPMILTYGYMLDTPVTAMPFGVATLLIWYRTWTADPEARRPATGVLFAAGALATLAGWQAFVLVALCSVTLLVRAVRGDRPLLPSSLALGAGGMVGLVLSLAWARWVYGGFDVLGDKFTGRTAGSAGAGVLDMVEFQTPWLFQLLGLGIIGVGGCIAALRSARLRPLAAMALAIVVVYALVFHAAAAGHQYWNYWAVIPTAVGFAHLFGRSTQELRSGAPVLIGACCAAVMAFTLIGPNTAADAIDDGHAVAEQLNALEPEAATAVYYVGEPYRPDAWVSYYTGTTPSLLPTASAVGDLAEQQPGAPVVILEDCHFAEMEELCEVVDGALAPPRTPVLMRSQQLERLLLGA